MYPLRSDQCKQSPDDLVKYGRDWTRIHKVQAEAILFPESTEDVQRVVEWANKSQKKLVPSGGRTGLAAGAVAEKGEVVVSLERMNRVLEFSPRDRHIRVQAGLVTETLQDYAAERSLYFPVDFASRGSSQIGGNIATNAGGIKVIRYGHMRDWVAGLQVVTGSGEVLSLDRNLVKDNSGYDLKHLFIGSEGTLGFVTEATLKLTSPPPPLAVLLVTTDRLENVPELLMRFRSQATLTAFEFFTDSAIKHVLAKTSLQNPFSNICPFYMLVEFESDGSDTEEAVFSVFENAKQEGIIQEGALSQNASQAAMLWKYRESITESLSSFQPYKSDIAVKVSDLPAFVGEADEILRKKYPQLSMVWFGHIGDGNLHINVLAGQGQSRENFLSECDRLSHDLFDLIKRYRGSISAEHGIGLIKKPYLSYTRSPYEIDLMRKIKRVFDPQGILNPGKIFD